jgi:hypothetical protein
MLLQRVEHRPKVAEEWDRYGTILELLTWGSAARTGEKVSTLSLARDGGNSFSHNFASILRPPRPRRNRAAADGM